MTESRINNSMSNAEFAKAEVSGKKFRRWLAVCAAIPMVVGVMILIAMSVSPSPRIGYLFDRRLFLFSKEGGGGPDKTCSGGKECELQCDVNACPTPDDARDCGCTTTATCWNEACETQCITDTHCETDACNDVCTGDQITCGCTNPQPPCVNDACADECLEDPDCENSDCFEACATRENALGCGCGVEDDCFNSGCRNQCNYDPGCETQDCQDSCVTETNTLACGCT
jgi:hypothetical protein